MSFITIFLFLPSVSAGEGASGQAPFGDSVTENNSASAIESVEPFIVFNEKLKNAVCDETFIAKAPTFESITDQEKVGLSFTVPLSASMTESDVISFLLGDSLIGFYSEYVKSQILLSLKQRGLDDAVTSRALTPDQFLEAQSAVTAVKRRLSLDVCKAIMNAGTFRQLLSATPSRVLDAFIFEKASVSRVEALDREGRFGRVHGALIAGKREPRYLIPGWLEAHEVERVVIATQGRPSYIYRRLSNPVTNNTQSIEINSLDRVPLGVLFLSHDPAPSEWRAYKDWAGLAEARVRQIEIYRQRIEFEAVKALESKRKNFPESFKETALIREKVRELQEFYKKVLQAYQLLPNEKQFDAYVKASGRKKTLDEITRTTLGADFLNALRQARVNGSYVHLGLFKPDPKLHAIYIEYTDRLTKLLSGEAKK